MAEMDDPNILEQMRRAVDKEPLTEDTLRDLFQKYNAFLNSLTGQQRALVMNSHRSLEDAADSLDDVSPEQLEAFLEKFTPPGGIVLKACGRHFRDDMDE